MDTPEPTSPPAAIDPEAPRIGRDELNLAEFPFAVLSRRGRSAPLTLDFKDGQKEWSVAGHPKHGLPSAADVQVYVILMEMTRQQGFPAQVQFSRHEVIQRLGWDPHGESYDRVLLALHRLVGLTISTKNAWYDAANRRWERNRTFHILESFDLTDSRQARRGEPSLFPSWVRWSPELYANIQAGHIKALDVSLFLSLRNPVSQALFRYLDAKRYDGKPQYRIGLRKLAFEHLGFSRNYYPSQIKRQLDPAHEELVARGFLATVEYALMKNGEEMAVYSFARASLPSAEGPVDNPEEAAAQLRRRLVEAGVTERVARELAASDPDGSRQQLEYLPHRGANDPGAVLVKSIREQWAPPPAWTQAEDARKAATEQEKQRREAEARAAAIAEEKAATEAAWEAWWDSQPEADRAAFTEQAEAELRRANATVSELGRRRPDSPVYQAALRDLLRRLSGWG